MASCFAKGCLTALLVAASIACAGMRATAAIEVGASDPSGDSKVESRSANAIDQLRWLTGSWMRKSSRGRVHEKWTLLSDRTFEGRSWRLVDGSETPIESLLLVEMEDEVFYIAKVAENPYPVPFRLTALVDGRAVFENPDHDFPTKIVYARNDDGSMTVSTEGPDANGELRRVDFEFTRGN